MEGGLAPAAHVVAIGGVENPALSLLAHPRPWLILAALEDGAVVAVAVMHIGFVPGFEPLVTAHDGMLRRGDGGAEHTIAVGLETAADEFDVGFGFPKAGGRAMNRQKPAAVFNEAGERRLLPGIHRTILFPVAIKHHRVKPGEHVLAEVGQILRVSQINAGGAESLLQHPVAFDRIVAGVVLGRRTEKQHFHATRIRARELHRLGEDNGCGKQAERQQQDLLHTRFGKGTASR
jgi:hypothetical protein